MSTPPCRFYVLGTCRNGTSCSFPHVNAATSNQAKPQCRFFSTPQGCTYGDRCHFAHTNIPISVPLTTGQDPIAWERLKQQSQKQKEQPTRVTNAEERVQKRVTLSMKKPQIEEGESFEVSYTSSGYETLKGSWIGIFPPNGNRNDHTIKQETDGQLNGTVNIATYSRGQFGNWEVRFFPDDGNYTNAVAALPFTLVEPFNRKHVSLSVSTRDLTDGDEIVISWDAHDARNMLEGAWIGIFSQHKSWASVQQSTNNLLIGEMKLTLDAKDTYGDYEVRYMNHRSSNVPLATVLIKVKPKNGACLHENIHANPYREVYVGMRTSGDDFYFTMYTCQQCKKKWTNPSTTIANTESWNPALNGNIKCVFEERDYAN
jgi:hypothetical protein